MQSLAKQIIGDFKHLTFEDDEAFVWSPTSQSVHFDSTALQEPSGIWSLLHEIGHAELRHSQYRDDFHLLIMEVQAWAKAKELAKLYEIDIDEAHIEHCVDSYRDWLHKRSKCPDCRSNAFALSNVAYLCHNCGCEWQVPASKICKIRKTRK